MQNDPATQRWNIRISGYGSFEFIGTEAEAEEMRANKAQWERANGIKWRADNQRPSDKLTAKAAALWDDHQGVPRLLLKRRAAALAAEAA